MKAHAVQSGAVLIVSLIMLLLMTIIGIAGMRTTVLEEKMAGNLGDLNVAFEAAESALREGEVWLTNLSSSKPDPVGSCTTAPCNIVFARDSIIPMGTGAAWNTPAVRTYAGASLIPNVVRQPEYYLEHERFQSDSLNEGLPSDNTGRDIYRVTARGTGGSATTQAILRTTYARRF
jgi:type IV pilus assembly protein PilX